MKSSLFWVVLGDGKYVRIFFNQGPDCRLAPLRSDDFEHLSDLSYEMITGKSRHAASGTDQAVKRSYCQLLAEFLARQCESQSFDHLVIVAPADVLKEIHSSLPGQVERLIAGEVEADLLSKSVSAIEDILGNMLVECRQKTGI